MRRRHSPAEPSRDLEIYERHAEICKVFSNATRLRILNVLRERDMTVAAIADELEMPLGTVSAHLLLMRRRHVLASRKEGNQVFYRLASPKMLGPFDLLRELLLERIKEEGVLLKRLEGDRTDRPAASGKRGRASGARS